MNIKIKNTLGLAGICMILAIGHATVSVAGSYSRSSEPSSFRSFQVTASGESVGVPDIATFTYGIVIEGGKDLSKIQTEASAKSEAVNTFIKAQEVASADIKTQGYNVSPRYQYFSCDRYSNNGINTPCPPAEIVGYTIRETVEVKIRDFEVIGTVLGGVVEAGANTVSSLRFEIDNPTDLEDAARNEAIEKAMEKAHGIAQAGNFSVGKLLSISEGYTSYPQSRNFGFAESDEMSLSKMSAPQIEAGSKDIKTTITLTYEIR